MYKRHRIPTVLGILPYTCQVQAQDQHNTTPNLKLQMMMEPKFVCNILDNFVFLEPSFKHLSGRVLVHRIHEGA
jgi:hypothetical protein